MGPVQEERDLARHQPHRSVGRQPRRLHPAIEADMVAALRAPCLVRALAVARRDADRDARPALDRFDDAHQHRRTEHPAEAREARRKIGDPYAALGSPQLRDEHGRVGQVGLARLRHALERNGEGARASGSRGRQPVAADQAAEERIAVEARPASPDDRAGAIHQRGHLAIADDAEVERGEVVLRKGVEALRCHAACGRSVRLGAGDAGAAQENAGGSTSFMSAPIWPRS